MDKPTVIDRGTLVAILLDMANRVSKGDSIEGRIEYYYKDEQFGAGDEEFSALGAYRFGNTEGQGGMRVIAANS